jgi:ATP-binding cassette subfamily G (WHITE) protein 1/ATP-binding cassette subfamily G (WHITE) protein 2
MYVCNSEDLFFNNANFVGGERKRLAIGCEVVSCRGLRSRAEDEGIHLLIADEPTSGLDSYQALRVVRVLKELSKSRNLAVVATLHQPRSMFLLTS